MFASPANAITLVLTALLAAPAFASVPVTTDQPRSFDFVQNDSTSVSFEPFDDLDGAMTLHQVRLRVEATLEAAFSLTNLSTVPVDTDAYVQETLVLALPELIAAPAVVIDMDTVLSCNPGGLLAPGATCDYGGTFIVTGSLEITRDDAETLAAFTGSSSIDALLEGFGSIDYDGDLYAWTIETHVVSGDMTLTYTFSDTPEPCPADVTRDGITGFDDLLRVLMNWGSCMGCEEDVDDDDIVDGADLLHILADWGPC